MGDATNHINAAMSTVEQFSYLLRYRAREAASAVPSLPTTDACYDDVVETLKGQYPDKRRLEDMKGLRKRYDLTQLNSALGASTAGSSAMLCYILQKALPYETVRKCRRRVSLMEMFGRTPREQETGGSVQASSIPSHLSVRLKDLLHFLQMEVAICDHSSRRNLAEMQGVEPSSKVLHSGAKAADVCYFGNSVEHETASCDGEATLKKRKLARGVGCFWCTIKDTELGSGAGM